MVSLKNNCIRNYQKNRFATTMYKALFAYEADSKTDIHLDVGDSLCKVEDVGNGWSMGYNVNRGTTGTFPTNYITRKTTIRDKMARVSFSPKHIDNVTINTKDKRESTNKVPLVKAKIPDHILQRRQSRVPEKDGESRAKFLKIIPQPVQSFGNILFQSNRGEHRIIKAICGILGGFITCGILFVLLQYSYDNTLERSAYITLAASVPICMALAVSTHMRCIILLMIPSLFTGKGRTVIMGIIFAMLLAGPVVNIAYNTQQASNSMACTQELIYNQTTLLKNQLEEPVRKLEQRIYEGLKNLEILANSIEKAIAPITNAVNSFLNGLNAAKNGLEYAAKKCDKGIKSAHDSCRKGMSNAKSKCEKELRKIDPTDKIIRFGKGVVNRGKDVERKGRDFGKKIGRGLRRVFGGKKRRKRAMTEEERNAIVLARQLMGTDTLLKKHGINLRSRNAGKIMHMEEQDNQTAHIEEQDKHGALERYKRFSLLDKICKTLDMNPCKVIKFGQNVCKPLKLISTAIKRTSNDIRSTLNTIIKFFSFKIKRHIDASGNINSSKSATQIMAEVKADIESKTSWILTVANIVSNVLAITFLFLFINSLFYLKNFLSKDQYDNFYITKSFKVYDQQCKTTGKSALLPLKRKERKKYVDTRSLWLSSKELNNTTQGLVKVAIHFLIATVIIFFDYVLYFVLQLIDRYGNLNINLGGSTTFDVSVEGKGLISKFLKVFLTSIELNSEFDLDFNLTTCIPNPSQPNVKNIYIFGFLYFFIFFLVILQAYGLRLRRKIATFFYPERDAERIHYLHEKIEANRKSFVSWLNHRLASNHKQHYVENRMAFRGWLEYRHPRIAKCFCCCLPKKKICICCSNEQDRTTKFHQCEKCHSEYCDDCYRDMQYTCLICSNRAEASSVRK